MRWLRNLATGGILGRFPAIIREVRDRYGVVALVCLIIGAALLIIVSRDTNPVLVGICFVCGATLIGFFGYKFVQIDSELRQQEDRPTEHTSTPGAKLDVAIVAERDLMRLPNVPSEPTEREAIAIARRLFDRQFFYASDEKDISAGLWVVAKTRLVWEQQVVPRVTNQLKEQAERVKFQLLKLQNFHQNMLQAPEGEINSAIITHSNDKDAFLAAAASHRRAVGYRNRIIAGSSDEKERLGLLKSLRLSLSKVGIRISPTRRPPFTVEPGGE